MGGARAETLAHTSGARLAASAWVAAAFVLWMPAAVTFPGTGLDASWKFGVVMAFDRHLQWGRDIVFTYGPLGALDNNRGDVIEPGAWLTSLAFAIAVQLAFSIALAIFLRAFDAHPLTWALALLVLLLPESTWALTEIELLLLPVIALSVAVRVESGGAFFAAAGGSLIALQVLCKGSLVVGAASILAGFAVAAWISGRRKQLAAALVSLVVSFLALYSVAGQDPGSLPGYLRTTYELVAGYSPAMSNIADQPPQVDTGLLRWLGFALVPITTAEAFFAFRRRDRGLLALALICIPMTFLSFKEGFVRWKLDYFVFIATLIELLMFVAILAPRRRPRGPVRAWLDLGPMATAAFWRRRLPVLGLAVAGAAVLLPVATTALAVPALHADWPAGTIGDRIATYQQAATMVESATQRDRMSAQTRAAVIAADPLPPALLARIGHAPVDVMPWDIDVIAAYHLNWTPRPVMQSYTAYTSYLDGMDAAFIRGSGAPGYIITTLRTIDNRYALFEEPAMQRALLERYRVDAVASGWVLLRRAADICPCQIRELESVSAAAGESVTPPTAARGERVFVRVGLDASLAGRAASLVFDAGAVRVDLKSAGTETTFRLVTGTAADGLLVSDFVGSAADLATLYSGCETSGAVNSIAVQPDNPPMFGSTVTYDFFAERTGPCSPVPAP